MHRSNLEIIAIKTTLWNQILPKAFKEKARTQVGIDFFQNIKSFVFGIVKDQLETSKVFRENMKILETF